MKVVPPQQMEEWQRQARELKSSATDQTTVADPAQTEPYSLNYDWFHEERLPKYFKTYEIKEYLTKGYHLLAHQKSQDEQNRIKSADKSGPVGSRDLTNQEIRMGSSDQSGGNRPNVQIADQEGHGHESVGPNLTNTPSQSGNPEFKAIGGTKFNFSSSKEIKTPVWGGLGPIQPVTSMTLANAIESPTHPNGTPEDGTSPKKPRFTLAAMHQFKRRTYLV